MSSKRLQARLLLWGLLLALLAIPVSESFAEESAANAMQEMSIFISGDVDMQGGVSVIRYLASNDSFTLSWTEIDGADAYQVSIDPGAALTQEGTQLSLSAAGYLHETYTFTVSALSGETVCAQATLRFRLEQMESPQGGAGGMEGAMISGMSRRGGGFSSGSITPGKALTTAHAEGDGDDSLYGAILLPQSSETTGVFSLGDSGLDIVLDQGENPFEVSFVQNTLTLTPVDGGNCFQLSAAALRLLKRSGANRVTVILDGQAHALSTDWEPEGRVYAQLRAQGLTAKDFLLVITGNGLQISVQGKSYRLTEENQLVQD